MKRRPFPKDARYLCVGPETAARLRSREIPQVGRVSTTQALELLAILIDKRVPEGSIVILNHRREPFETIDLNKPGLEEPKGGLRYRVRGGSFEPVSCRFCPGKIVWHRITTSGATMPLSWSSREAWIENGRQVGLIFLPHFVDCPNWHKRSEESKT